MKHLVTTALAYTNGPLHLGHARSTYIPADIYTRYLRLKGEEVVHVGGTDNHGVPITLTAEREGVKPIDIVDRYHNAIKADLDSLNVAFDTFGRTHSDIHIETAQEFYSKLKENGYIYEKEIEQFYCEKCDMYLADRYVEGICPFCEGEARGDHCEVCGRHLEPTELVNPYCIHCNSKPEIKRTTHYFFKLSAMQDVLKEYIENSPEMPEHVKNMALRWIEELHDWDVSRNIKWGVPIPGCDDQVMYVWIEAPIGYVSFTKQLGDVWKSYWLENTGDSKISHFIGKDITVHHAVFWPGILKGIGGYKMPNAVVSGGYLTLENKKMSTSKNWVVWVKDFIENFSSDYLRYFFMINAPLNRDTDFSWDDFQKRINTELIDIIGNFTHRTLVFTERKFGSTPVVDLNQLNDEDKKLISKCEDTLNRVDSLIREYNFKDALMEIILLAKDGNAYFQGMAPWAITDDERLKEVMYTCSVALKYIIYLLSSFMPEKTALLLEYMNEELDLEVRGNPLEKPKVIFTKVSDEDISRMKENLMKATKKAETKVDEKSKKVTSGEKMEMIDIDYFGNVDLRVGQILEVEEVPRSKKLYKIIADLGEEKRQIVSGLKGAYEAEELVGKKVIIICNLKPAKLCGVESQGMLLAAEDDSIVSLLALDRDLPVGSKIH